jgi:hypothetical protein
MASRWATPIDVRASSTTVDVHNPSNRWKAVAISVARALLLTEHWLSALFCFQTTELSYFDAGVFGAMEQDQSTMFRVSRTD